MLPSVIATAFITAADKESLWRCPPCAFQRVNECAEMDDDDDDGGVSASGSKTDQVPATDSVLPSLDSIPSEVRPFISHLLKEFKDMATELKEVKAEMKTMRRHIDVKLPTDFSPLCVATWKDLDIPAMRTLILNACRIAFRIHHLPQNINGAVNHEFEIEGKMATLTRYMEGLPDKTPDDACLLFLHNAVIDLTGHTILGQFGHDPKRAYITAARSYTAAGFTSVVQQRLMADQTRKGEDAKKARNRSEGNFSRNKSIFTDNNRNSDRSRDYDRPRDYDRQSGKDGHARAQQRK